MQRGKKNVSTDLKAGGTPVNELDVALGLDGSDGVVDVLGHHITTIEQAARHVLAVARITLHHLVRWLEARVGDLGDAVLLVVSLLRRHHRRVGG